MAMFTNLSFTKNKAKLYLSPFEITIFKIRSVAKRDKIHMNYKRCKQHWWYTRMWCLFLYDSTQYIISSKALSQYLVLISSQNKVLCLAYDTLFDPYNRSMYFGLFQVSFQKYVELSFALMKRFPSGSYQVIPESLSLCECMLLTHPT